MFNLPFFFLKSAAPSQEYGSCYQIVCFYGCWFWFCCILNSVSDVPLVSSYSSCVSFSFSLYTGFIFSQSFYDTTVAFIKYKITFIMQSLQQPTILTEKDTVLKILK